MFLHLDCIFQEDRGLVCFIPAWQRVGAQKHRLIRKDLGGHAGLSLLNHFLVPLSRVANLSAISGSHTPQGPEAPPAGQRVGFSSREADSCLL